jgi:hypothetical protein
MRMADNNLFPLQHHKIKVLDALLCVLAHSFPKYCFIDDVPNVLVDEIISVQSDQLVLTLFSTKSTAS